MGCGWAMTDSEELYSLLLARGSEGVAVRKLVPAMDYGELHVDLEPRLYSSVPMWTTHSQKTQAYLIPYLDRDFQAFLNKDFKCSLSKISSKTYVISQDYNDGACGDGLLYFRYDDEIPQVLLVTSRDVESSVKTVLNVATLPWVADHYILDETE